MKGTIEDHILRSTSCNDERDRIESLGWIEKEE